METNSIITTLPLSSSQLNELFCALSKAQAQMHAALKNSDNPFFKSKYADFGEIVTASRPALTNHGLCVTQRIVVLSDGTEALHSILGHSSGQYIDSLMRIRPVKNDVQSMGSYITYLKRYAYAALVGVITEDDDGEQAVDRQQQGSNKNNAVHTDQAITKEQVLTLAQLLSSSANGSVIEGHIKEKGKITNLTQLTQKQFPSVEAYIRKQLDSIQV